MHKIDGAGHVNNEFVIEDLALNRPPTEVTAEWLNTIQDEIANVVLESGVPLNKLNNAQLHQAIIAHIGNYLTSQFTGAGKRLLADNGYQMLPGGLLVQWVSGLTDVNGLMQVNWPVSFPNAILGGIANERNPAGWDSIYGGTIASVWGFAIESTINIARANVRIIINNQAPAKQANIAGKIIAWGY